MWNLFRRAPEFVHLGPQVIKHRSGYLVQPKDRDHERYINGSRSGTILVDRGKAIVNGHEVLAYTLYQISFAWEPPFQAEPTTAQKRNEIIQRIRAALEFDGIHVTIA